MYAPRIPHPAIVSRLFDFDFDSCSLSVLHFLRWDIDAQINTEKTKTVNLRNFSPKVELADIPEHPEYWDLLEVISVLHTFAQEFFDVHTQALVAAAKKFGDRLSREIVVLASWFTSVFGAYRTAVINAVSLGLCIRSAVQNRFNTQDGEISKLLFQLVREPPRSATTLPTAPTQV
ncbi:hypothetical protein L917_13025, partial [Phytophthora nicotianae]